MPRTVVPGVGVLDLVPEAFPCTSGGILSLSLRLTCQAYASGWRAASLNRDLNRDLNTYLNTHLNAYANKYTYVYLLEYVSRYMDARLQGIAVDAINHHLSL